MFGRTAVLVVIGLATQTALGGGQATSNEGASLAVPRPDWDRAFERTDGWTGGDVALAVDLDGRRTAWLWGDSWIGPVVAGRHGPGARLVNNALALHDRPRAKGEPPEDIAFFWGASDKEGRPTAWIVPDGGRVTARRTGTATADPTFYWMASGIAVLNPQGTRRLILFLWHVGKTAGGGVWNFESVGGALAIVDNPDEPVAAWRVTQHDIPHAVPDAARDRLPAKRTVSWGSALLLAPRDPVDPNPTDGDTAPRLYVYGNLSGGWGHEMLLARVPSDRAQDFSRWEFRAADGWTERLEEAASLARGMVSEFTVSPVELGGRARYLVIQSEPFFGTRILARVADSPSGPWTDPVPIYQVPDIDPKRKHFTYAAKAHPHLSASGKLLVTYIVNSHDFGSMVSDASIYRPRFIEVDLALLAAKFPAPRP